MCTSFYLKPKPLQSSASKMMKDKFVDDVLCLKDVQLHCNLTQDDLDNLRQLRVPMQQQEHDRIRLLRQSQLLDSTQEEDYDRLTALAARALKAPLAVVSLIDVSRQWFKARVGVPVNETHRDLSFCSFTILESSPEVMVVPDALEDERFKANPLVLEAPFMRFYAGAALYVQGVKVGTLCVFDTKPRHDFGLKQQLILSDIADMVSNLVQTRRAHRMQVEQELARITMSVMYIIKQPLDMLTKASQQVDQKWRELAMPVASEQSWVDVSNEADMLQEKADILGSMLNLSLNVTSRLLDMGHSGIKHPRLVPCNLPVLMHKAEVLLSRCRPSCTMDWDRGFLNANPTQPSNKEELLLCSHPDLLLLVMISLMTTLCNENSKVQTVHICQEEVQHDVVLTQGQICSAVERSVFENIASLKCRCTQREASFVKTLRSNRWTSGFLVMSVTAEVKAAAQHRQLEYDLQALRYMLEGVGGSLLEESFPISSDSYEIRVEVRLPCLEMSPSSGDEHPALSGTDSERHIEVVQVQNVDDDDDDDLNLARIGRSRNSSKLTKSTSRTSSNMSGKVMFSIFRKSSSAKIHCDQLIQTHQDEEGEPAKERASSVPDSSPAQSRQHPLQTALHHIEQLGAAIMQHLPFAASPLSTAAISPTSSNITFERSSNHSKEQPNDYCHN